jgi:putative inorganic carbon (hco3(-)) transporter
MTSIAVPRLTAAATAHVPASMREVAYLTTWLFVAAVPLLNTVQVPGVGSIARIAGVPLVVAAVVVLAADGQRRRPRDFHALLFAFTVWVVASYMWSGEPGASASRILTTVQLLVMVMLIWEFADTRERLRGLLAAFVVGAGGALFALLYQAATTIGDPTRYRLAESHPNSLSFVLGLAVPIAWYLGSTSEHRTAQLLYHLYVPPAILGIAISGSRGAIPVLLVGLTIIPLTSRHMPVRRRLVTVAILLATSVLAISLAPDKPLERLSTISEEVAGGDFNGRAQLWDHGTQIVADHPFIGIGTGASRFAVGELSGEAAGLHNTYLSVAAELGAVGLALFLLVIVAAFVHASRARGVDRRMLFVVGATLLVGLLPRHWEYERPVWLILALMVGFGAAAQRRRPEVMR